jgi:HAD superfamily hydrolase (TIGR01484 family)
MIVPKMSIFDVDGTLCSLGRKLGEPLAPEVAVRLRSLEEGGNRIVLATGRPAQFALGIALGAGLNDPIIVGDNGCIIYDMAGKEVRMAERPPEIELLMDELLRRYGEEIYFAPNQISCTVFPKGELGLKEELKSYVRQSVMASRGRMTLFEHAVALDIIPGGVDKGMAARVLMKTFGISRSEVYAVGDGINDLPLFSAVGHSIIIGYQVDYPGAQHCSDILDALQILEYRSRARAEALRPYFPTEAWMGLPRKSRRRSMKGKIAL